MAVKASVLSSRKFCAYLIGEFTWKVILAGVLYGLFTVGGGHITLLWMGVLMSIIFTAGLVQVGYIGGQAWVDRYTQGITSLASSITRSSDGNDEPGNPFEVEGGDGDGGDDSDDNTRDED